MHADDDIRRRIADLRIEHRSVDDLIVASLDAPDADDLLLRRLKKRKLLIRDSIVMLQMRLTPDVPA